jgi:surface carbohydrate biosynthesis protein
MEVRSRELEGRLLLALIAAERGHDVLLGELDHLLSHRHWLPPGVFHDTTLAPAPFRLGHLARLTDAGFLVTSQDEEHGLTEGSIEAFVAKRYSAETLSAASATFAWGPTDAAAVEHAHPEHAARMFTTGSPRADLWRPDMTGFYAELPLPGVPVGQEFVLVSTNLAPAAANRFWVQMRDLRPVAFDGPEDPEEFANYTRAGREHLQAGRLVRTVRQLAARHPDLLIVVRPHPMEAEGAWEDMLGPISNVLVTREASIGRWIRRAVALIHVRSTSAFEAAIAGVPVIAFRAEHDGRELAVDRIGAQAHDEDAVLEQVERARDPQRRADWFAASAPLLRDLFAAIDGPLAADRIVDVWDGLDVPNAPRLNSPRFALGLANAHRRAGAVRTHLRGLRRDAVASTPKGGRFETAHKFPALTRADVEPVVTAHRASLDRFADVRVRIIGPRLLHLHRRD